MFSRQREKSSAFPIALVAINMQKMQMRLLFSPKAIGKRMRELDHDDHRAKQRSIEDAPDNFGLEEIDQGSAPAEPRLTSEDVSWSSRSSSHSSRLNP
jgi:hypothetical protein